MNPNYHFSYHFNIKEELNKAIILRLMLHISNHYYVKLFAIIKPTPLTIKSLFSKLLIMTLLFASLIITYRTS